MKIWKSIPLLLTAIFLGLFLLSSSSCSPKTYSAKNKIGYKRSDRIKVYKSNSNRNSFVHDKNVRKKYVIKKK
ncbi:MAG: hypothetical protein RQ761_09145 [Bacteroidales bacterium]|nr:hypothetical protein [Bacteroidales bacterium]